MLSYLVFWKVLLTTSALGKVINHPTNYGLREVREYPATGAMGAGPFASMEPQKSPLLAATYYFDPVSGRSQNLEQLGLNTQSIVRSLSSKENEVALEACVAADGREGTCYDASFCMELGGVPMGQCEDSGSSVCCLFEVSCDDDSYEEFTYFKSPLYPRAYDKERMCKIRVGKKKSTICQLRLDFLDLDIARPTEGNCSQDMLFISGQNENNVVPRICGLNTGHHFYVDVDESGMVSIQVMMIGSYSRKFNIKITQLECKTNKIVPEHCLQYYTGTHGVIKSFNYEEGGATTFQGYPNNLDYTICLKKEPGFCSISYELASDVTGVQPFGVGLVSASSSSTVTGPVSAECPDDFLVIGGIRLCSGRIAASTTSVRGRETNTTVTGLLTDSTPGPFMVRFVSNGVNNARGFNLQYRLNPCK
ncbi:uncharacterized protein LOC111086022 [Limulus polyphemus]|uniref:Uncharacterized protein LOC111086022 n=1 Tax=Limulus polyphemus TaxID=6850 RepID=A0ABM1SHA2_LIMPO|nr:uncharacterized protein LOC111086022 [Limulus polyphemus]